MIGLSVLVNKTKIGKAMRAVSEDNETAQLMGINVNNTISFTFGLGSALAAVAAVLYSCSYAQLQPTMGSMLGLKAFVAAVLGGIGSIPGAVLGGFLIGLAESLTKGYISSQLSDAVVFGILIVVLMIKPTGILGRNYREKV
jgi:branched-chain amino acid transport system permease protein